MAQESQKEELSGVVRIWTVEKKGLEEVREEKAKQEKRPFTEVELASKAIRDYVRKEKRKLGIA
jgi:predicted nucleotidyltransferase